MKTTTVPAQVTTVEDRVAGNLSFAQLFIVSLPVFISGLIYVAVPPFLHMPLYKSIVCSAILLICLTLALRVRGKLVVQWLVVLSRYNSRPRYYVYNKNDAYLRTTVIEDKTVQRAEKVQTVDGKPKLLPKLSIASRVRLEGLVSDPRAQTRFEISKQGGLNVRITEVKPES